VLTARPRKESGNDIIHNRCRHCNRCNCRSRILAHVAKLTSPIPLTGRQRFVMDTLSGHDRAGSQKQHNRHHPGCYSPVADRGFFCLQSPTGSASHLDAGLRPAHPSLTNVAPPVLSNMRVGVSTLSTLELAIYSQCTRRTVTFVAFELNTCVGVSDLSDFGSQNHQNCLILTQKCPFFDHTGTDRPAI